MPHIAAFTVRVPKHLSVARREYFFVPTRRHLRGPRHWRIEAISALLDLTIRRRSLVCRADDETAPQFAPDSPPSREGVATEQFLNQIAVPIATFIAAISRSNWMSFCFCITSYARGDGCFPRRC
jgi:hypothetical protein